MLFPVPPGIIYKYKNDNIILRRMKQEGIDQIVHPGI